MFKIDNPRGFSYRYVKLSVNYREVLLYNLFNKLSLIMLKNVFKTRPVDSKNGAFELIKERWRIHITCLLLLRLIGTFFMKWNMKKVSNVIKNDRE